jgi:hypothetical protein
MIADSMAASKMGGIFSSNAFMKSPDTCDSILTLFPCPVHGRHNEFAFLYPHVFHQLTARGKA